jgi:hypothetical protein
MIVAQGGDGPSHHTPVERAIDMTQTGVTASTEATEIAPTGAATIRRAEIVDGETPVTLANEAAIRRAFEGAGIQFIDDNGGGEGVRFWKPQAFKKRK